MLDRIDPALLYMRPKVGLVTDMPLPEPALPDSPFLPGLVAWTKRPQGQAAREPRLDQPPPHRIVRVALGQGPDRMQMVRQHHPGIDLDGPFGARPPNRVSQGADMSTKSQDLLSAKATAKNTEAPGPRVRM